MTAMGSGQDTSTLATECLLKLHINLTEMRALAFKRILKPKSRLGLIDQLLLNPSTKRIKFWSLLLPSPSTMKLVDDWCGPRIIFGSFSQVTYSVDMPERQTYRLVHEVMDTIAHKYSLHLHRALCNYEVANYCQPTLTDDPQIGLTLSP